MVTDLVLALAVRIPSLLGVASGGEVPQRLWVLDVLMLTFVPVVVFAAVRLARLHKDEAQSATRASGDAQTMRRTSREWLWAVNSGGIITFSSPMCERLTGYSPQELVGSPMSLVLDPAELATIGSPPQQTRNADVFERVTVVCRHRDGSPVLLEATGQAILDDQGIPGGFEGMARAANVPGSGNQADSQRRQKLDEILSSKGLVTAFQPFWCLRTGSLLGAEALSRFPGAEESSPEVWFIHAAATGRGAELELLAVTTALREAVNLPEHLTVAVNLTPSSCLEPRLTDALLHGPLPPSRLILEITERQEVADYAALATALAPLREAGMKLAIDDAGAGFASLRHILRLNPDIIKLDRSIVKAIDSETSHRALGAAMVSFAAETGSCVLAEGIETASELAAVRALGMAAAQGYHLGRPSTLPADWAAWTTP